MQFRRLKKELRGGIGIETDSFFLPQDNGGWKELEEKWVIPHFSGKLPIWN
jgi:hypothetical protein